MAARRAVVAVPEIAVFRSRENHFDARAVEAAAHQVPAHRFETAMMRAVRGVALPGGDVMNGAPVALRREPCSDPAIVGGTHEMAVNQIVAVPPQQARQAVQRGQVVMAPEIEVVDLEIQFGEPLPDPCAARLWRRPPRIGRRRATQRHNCSRCCSAPPFCGCWDLEDSHRGWGLSCAQGGASQKNSGRLASRAPGRYGPASQRRFARDTSSSLRGVPSGLLLSNASRPV